MWVLALFPALSGAAVLLWAAGERLADRRSDLRAIRSVLRDRPGVVDLGELRILTGIPRDRLYGRLARMHKSDPAMAVLDDPDTGRPVLTYCAEGV